MMSRNMANSIPPALASSARIHNALMNFYHNEPDKTFADIVADYRRDAAAFEAAFLRVPNAGRKTLNQLIDFLDRSANGFTGCVGYVTIDQATKGRKAIDEACHYISADSPLYQSLRQVELWLTAATLHIEQERDLREAFNRSAE